MEPTSSNGPEPADIRRQVTRGHRLVVHVDPAADMPAVTAAARALRTALPADLVVIASPTVAGGGPGLTVLRLVAEEEARELRPALDRLIAEFRQVSGSLVARLRAEVLPAHDRGAEYPDEVRALDGTWDVHLHGDHCRFENPASGETVEASIDDPDAIDPYFLLLFARTSGRHRAVHDACLEGFHDMCRLLDLAGVDTG
ncbi:hypothetical protein F0L68_36125 [Solihabitans fulvus]|uniref:DUF6896 domain-containing protein n=1 Tax=Solihabitans fulvus TaxID=1892852 RepID=A0A5B2WPW6_9PSEU|nr:hypothetical protein [Solihabitans fulvus]KAA2252469.1 hypothetical protein F0L68_36125 [Solihabitans fulvus]